MTEPATPTEPTEPPIPYLDAFNPGGDDTCAPSEFDPGTAPRTPRRGPAAPTQP